MFTQLWLQQMKTRSARVGKQQHPKESMHMLSATLTISPPSLEQRFWQRRCNSRLNSLDSLYELCTTLIWLSILPMLEGSDRALGKASLLLAVTQLVIIHTAPNTWVKRRSLLLSTVLLLRCGLVLLQHNPSVAGTGMHDHHHQQHQQQEQQHQQQQQQQQQPEFTGVLDTGLASSMTLAAGLWGNLLFVLFHQQSVRWQAPLLAVSTLMQAVSSSSMWGGGSGAASSTPWAGSTFSSPCDAAATSSSSSASASSTGGSAGFFFMPAALRQQQQQPGQQHPDAELLGVSQALNWGFGLLAAGGINTGSCLFHMVVPGREASVLAAKLFVHGFGCFLLPLFIAYVIEWRYKVMFLLNACNLPQQQQLQVLTPAAAIVRASWLLSLLLYAGWLLMLATSSWIVCCAVASLLLD